MCKLESKETTRDTNRNSTTDTEVHNETLQTSGQSKGLIYKTKTSCSQGQAGAGENQFKGNGKFSC